MSDAPLMMYLWDLAREQETKMASNYHARIMNIRITNYTPEALTPEYREGHRDARHAAAEIALEADVRVERLSDHLRSRGEHITYLRTEAEVLEARVTELEAALNRVDQAMRELRPMCTDGGDIADVLDSFIPAVRDALPREGDAPCT